ncbi:MAG TPA: TatD family hydrolase [Acidimicrobiia bacterium]|nr:TatD family hydrolase [Acidimicrobiia bacterium]
MTWVDTHCHLQLDERPAHSLIDRADEVEWMVVPGIDADSSREAATLAGRHPGRLDWTAGLHPHHAERWPDEAERISTLAAEAAAVGETGLDYYRVLAPERLQKDSFRAQLELAATLAKPVVVHCRDAFGDVYDLIEATSIGHRTVLHCWTGGRKWTRRFLDLGVTFSFAGPLAFDTGHTIRLAAELVPPERAMVETDTPYLAPPPHRGEPNEPAWVVHTGEALATVWGVDRGEAARLTSATATRVFRTGS